MNAQPIISSLLDTDAYKLYMQQAVWHHYSDVAVEAEFICRDGEDLRPYRQQIEQQIAQMENLTLSTTELDYLRSLNLFQDDYLAMLQRSQLHSSQVEIYERNGCLRIAIKGLWYQVILWEVPLLALICEIRNRARYPLLGIADAVSRLNEKLTSLRATYGEDCFNHLNLIEFGSRRRFSLAVQQVVNQQLKQQLPDVYCGTSNLAQAMMLGVTVVGTQAHEWFQAHQQLVTPLELSQRRALEIWHSEYPSQLGIALTDCITMDAFLRDFDVELAKRYQGLRHDSGDPIQWGEKAIAHYHALGIDPKEKVLVFSDGLSLERAMELALYFKGRIRTSFGIGTQLSCDLSGVTPMNIVLKLVSCNGGPVAKLSDAPGKSICRDPLFLQRLKCAYGVDV